MRTVIISQARMGSTRLPGKVMLEAGGKPLLQHHLERLLRVRLADAVVVATTTSPAEEPIVALCGGLGIPVFRGSEEDVLDRYARAAEAHRADVVVRVTSDCPFIDPGAIDRTIQAFRDRLPAVDYVSNVLERTYPRGMDAEVFSIDALRVAQAEAEARSDREHVTPFIWRQPGRFRLANVPYERDASGYRLTVDTAEDLELARLLLAELNDKRPAFSLEDCLAALARRPDWVRINAHVEQKKL